VAKKKAAAEETGGERLFTLFDEDEDGLVSAIELRDALAGAGLELHDSRIEATMKALLERGGHPLDRDTFVEAITPSVELIERALDRGLIIPDWASFTDTLGQIYDEVEPEMDGAVADYIPQLGRVDPEQFGLAVCTIDGQIYERGDARTPYCVQSCCKPINYCVNRQALGRSAVHTYIGREPSGRGFNELTLNHEGRPHNPMINAGAIIGCALMTREGEPADRFEELMDTWRRLAGGVRPGFNNAVYQSERRTADRNFALAYFMREHGAFPEGSDLHETLEFYFQCCSIEQTCRSMARVAATLANAGVCPTTGEEVFDAFTVRDCLSLMSSCGMYDFSGEFAFTIGLPAKSGVSGAMMVVVPNVMGLAVWSPRLDRLGNSVRGVAVCEKLIEHFNFHNYDNLTGLSEKRDPRVDAPVQQPR
jgi:glutaminase